jgi:hypothetical protein
MGCHWYAAGSALLLLVMLAMIAFAAIMTAIKGPNTTASFNYQMIAGFIAFPAAIMSVFGAWLLTSPDPAASDQSGVTLRNVTRAGLIAHVISSPAQMYWSAATGAGASPAMQIISLVGVLAAIFAVVGWLLYFLHLRRLSLRLPAPRIAGQLRVIAFAFASLSLLLAAGGIGTMLLLPGVTAGGQMRPSALYFASASTACCSLGLFFVVEVWAIIIHLVLSARFKACLVAH